jgi:hypothetical protein
MKKKDVYFSLSYGGKFADLQFMDWLTNLIADLQFAICSAININLRICDCGLSLRICEFKKKLHGNPLANLPLVSTVVHLELRIFPRIFEQIRTGPNRILRGLGETYS